MNGQDDITELTPQQEGARTMKEAAEAAWTKFAHKYAEYLSLGNNAETLRLTYLAGFAEGSGYGINRAYDSLDATLATLK